MRPSVYPVTVIIPVTPVYTTTPHPDICMKLHCFPLLTKLLVWKGVCTQFPVVIPYHPLPYKLQLQTIEVR